jgi:hypothetical protein
LAWSFPWIFLHYTSTKRSYPEFAAEASVARREADMIAQDRPHRNWSLLTAFL